MSQVMQLRKRVHPAKPSEIDSEQVSIIETIDSTIELPKKRYRTISDSTRRKLIRMVEETGQSIKKVVF